MRVARHRAVGKRAPRNGNVAQPQFLRVLLDQPVVFHHHHLQIADAVLSSDANGRDFGDGQARCKEGEAGMRVLTRNG